MLLVLFVMKLLFIVSSYELVVNFGESVFKPHGEYYVPR